MEASGEYESNEQSTAPVGDDADMDMFAKHIQKIKPIENAMKEALQQKEVERSAIGNNTMQIILQSQDRRKHSYERRHINFHFSEEVLKQNNELQDRKGEKMTRLPWSGPYKIYSVIKRGTYHICRPGTDQPMKTAMHDNQLNSTFVKRLQNDAPLSVHYHRHHSKEQLLWQCHIRWCNKHIHTCASHRQHRVLCSWLNLNSGHCRMSSSGNRMSIHILGLTITWRHTRMYCTDDGTFIANNLKQEREPRRYIAVSASWLATCIYVWHGQSQQWVGFPRFQTRFDPLSPHRWKCSSECHAWKWRLRASLLNIDCSEKMVNMAWRQLNAKTCNSVHTCVTLQNLFVIKYIYIDKALNDTLCVSWIKCVDEGNQTRPGKDGITYYFVLSMLIMHFVFVLV